MLKAVTFPSFFPFVFFVSAIFLLPAFSVAQGFQEAESSSAPIAAPEVQAVPVAATVTIAPQETAVVATIAVQKKAGARLIISNIDVDAAIQDMGNTSDGAMAIPGNNVDVGWYDIGTRPGDTGSAVIGGHNRWGDSVAVFDRLDQLHVGDGMSVVDADGISTSFVVREMRTYAATDDAKDIFLSASGIHLNLITCSGVWDPATKSYTNRLVIFTDVVPLT